MTVLKELAEELALPLTLLLNKCFETGQMPSDWKTANVSCIFKKGSKIDPGNYRPVSLTCVICKMAESFLKDHIYNFVEEKIFFSDCQHGFRRARPCTTQLIQFTETLSDRLDNGEITDILYLDFQKAFDKVPHKQLLLKIKALGISGPIFKFIEDFLKDRKQRVAVEREYSEWTEVKSGIPQGSILGPLLFIIFINDLPDQIKNLCKIFADDTKIYGQPSIDLQSDLDTAVEWSDRWQMTFNPTKCTVLHMGEKNAKKAYYMKTKKRRHSPD